MSTTAFEENQLTWLSSLKALQSNQLISSNTQKLLQELRSTEVNINRICDLLASEPALTAKILMITNSAFYGYPREISDIEEAVVLMGAVQLSNIIYTFRKKLLIDWR
ncbi:MAG: HDOD domain-containing protein [Reinekea sp.]